MPLVKFTFFPDINEQILKGRNSFKGKIIILNKGNVATTLDFDLQNTTDRIALNLFHITSNNELPIDILKIDGNSSEGILYEITPLVNIPLRCDDISFIIRGPGVNRTIFKKGEPLNINFSIIFG